MKPVEGEDYPGRRSYTIENLRLNVAAVNQKKPWMLLPDGFRDMDSGLTYPLPTKKCELEALANLIHRIPRNAHNCGARYIRRCRDKVKEMNQKRQVPLSIVAQEKKHLLSEELYETRAAMKGMRSEARIAVAELKNEIRVITTNLNDLYALGRQGLDGMMRAHLEGKEWQKEVIDAEAFRSCFRLVTQAIKAMGVQTDQKEKAEEAIFEEAAASMRSTREVVAMSEPTPDGSEEKPH